MIITTTKARNTMIENAINYCLDIALCLALMSVPVFLGLTFTVIAEIFKPNTKRY